MRIAEIEAIGLSGGTPRGGWTVELEADDVVHTLIMVRTDEDAVGVGSVSSSYGLVRAALDVLRPLYTGQPVVEPDRVSEHLRQNSFWLGRGGSVTHTISGIDLALWDLAGQVYGQPAGRLLGGRYRDRVLPYASVLMDEPARMTAELVELREQGFRAFKIGWGPFGRVDPATDERIVAAARDAVGDSLLAVDAGGSDAFWPGTLSWAVRTSRMLAGYGVAWFEEALEPDAIDSYAELRRRSEVEISGGEVLTRRQAYRPYLRAGCFDIVQPDVTKVGGLGEALRIGHAAEDAELRLIPHGWNTAVGLAADLQLASALARTTLIEYRTGAPYIDELITTPWKLDADGMLEIPQTPGLGIELDQDALARYAVR